MFFLIQKQSYLTGYFLEQQWATAATAIASSTSARAVKAMCEGTRCSHSSWEAEAGRLKVGGYLDKTARTLSRER